MDKEIYDMQRQQEWNRTTNRIIQAIEDLKFPTAREEVIKIAVQYMVIKMCEGEDIFNDNLQILDRESKNGRYKAKEKKWKN